jgi:hypothetical protein
MSSFLQWSHIGLAANQGRERAALSVTEKSREPTGD